MRLKDKVAIVTGASNGIGAAEAALFAREEATVILTDIDDQRGPALAGQICNEGGKASFFKANASLASDWEKLLDHVIRQFGRLDVLVNNAGISSSAYDADDVQAWDALLDINARSAFLGTQLAGQIMKSAGKGAIVNTSSIFGIVGGTTGHPGYHASKAAVRNLTKAMAVRLAPHGVRVNSVHPGYMTPMVTARASGVDRGSKSPMGRVGQPIEVAYAALFLASDEASYITGAELAVDGGFLSQ